MEPTSQRLLAEQDHLDSGLFEWGFEPRLQELYRAFKAGDCSLGYLAEQMGISPWEAVHLLEDQGLDTTNL